LKALRLQAERLGAHSNDFFVGRATNGSEQWKNPKLTLEEVSRPIPKHGEVLLKVEYCGLCGSDFHLADPKKDSLAYPGLLSLPITIGHEFSGRVVAHGPGLSPATLRALPLGALVTAEEMLWCGECLPCRSGQLNHCAHLEEIGFTQDGAHAEFLTLPAKVCWSLDQMASALGETEALRLGALVEPYAVSYRALFQGAHGGKWAPGLKILVIGCGPIGAAALDLALLGGALQVDVLETDAGRRKFALSLGASRAHAPEEIDSLEATYDWIIDAAGAAELFRKILSEKISVGGTLCLLARSPAGSILQSEQLITKNARIVGSQGHSGESAFPRVISLLAAGKLQAEKFVTEIVSLEEALARLTNQKKCEGKILVKPANA